MTFYKDRFSDASGFTFVFVGSFDPDTLRPFVERYLGGLPSTRRGETWRDVGIRFPNAIAETTVEKGVDPKSEVAIVFAGPAAVSAANDVELQAPRARRPRTPVRHSCGSNWAARTASRPRQPSGRFRRPSTR